MKRKREILIGAALVLITLVVLGWISGYYFSPQACVEDSLRGLYFSPAEKIDEVQIGERYYYLYANDHQYALHGARKTACIFYITTGGSTHNDYADADEAFQIDGLSDGKNQLFVIHRSQPEIMKVEMDPGKGRPVIVFDQWEHDFSIKVQQLENSEEATWEGTYRAYDVQGNLVEERIYP